MKDSVKALAGLRIAVGVLFLIFAEYKLAGREFIHGGGFEGWIHRFLSEHGAYPFMEPVLRGFVLPNHVAIASFVSYGELAIGLALVLGIWVRAASIGGIVYMLALLFASNYPGANAPLWEYFGASLDHLVFALCFIAFAAAGNGGIGVLERFTRRGSRRRRSV